jgi:hypothetical protein
MITHQQPMELCLQMMSQVNVYRYAQLPLALVLKPRNLSIMMSKIVDVSQTVPAQRPINILLIEHA